MKDNAREAQSYWQEIPFYKDLTETQQVNVIMGAITIKFAEGDTLMDENGVQDSFFIVKEVRAEARPLA